MHLHAGQFQVLSVRVAGAPYNRGKMVGKIPYWPFGEKLRIIVRFQPQRQICFHCHNLEHEDGGMM
ncbi:MAG: multicopper oxidase domain-containing protein [Lewinellaceae bacterium]|nr:multicopper oxidase domain-containing protein [Lewinellaceae bacterium]